MSHKLGTTKDQRGTSPALSVRFDDDTHAEILELEDLSGETKSDIVRLFVAEGLSMISNGRARKAGGDLEVLWRTVQSNRDRIQRTKNEDRGGFDDDALTQLRNQLNDLTVALDRLTRDK